VTAISYNFTDEHLSTQFYIPDVVTDIQPTNSVGPYGSESVTF